MCVQPSPAPFLPPYPFSVLPSLTLPQRPSSLSSSFRSWGLKDSISKPRTSLWLKWGVCSAATLPFTNAPAWGGGRREEGEIPVNLVNLALSVSFVHCYWDSDALISREALGGGCLGALRGCYTVQSTCSEGVCHLSYKIYIYIFTEGITNAPSYLNLHHKRWPCWHDELEQT